jgi:hypothetical protein
VEALERQEALHDEMVRGRQILEVEEVHVAGEVAEQIEGIRVPGERVAQRARLVAVVPPNDSTVRSNRSLIRG